MDNEEKSRKKNTSKLFLRKKRKKVERKPSHIGTVIP